MNRVETGIMAIVAVAGFLGAILFAPVWIPLFAILYGIGWCIEKAGWGDN